MTEIPKTEDSLFRSAVSTLQAKSLAIVGASERARWPSEIFKNLREFGYPGRIVLINPEFVRREGMQLVEEGCLSVPGFHATVARPATVTVRGLTPNGRERSVDADGFLARAIQHEMDHLDGILFIDRLRAVQRRLILRRIESLRRTGQW